MKKLFFVVFILASWVAHSQDNNTSNQPELRLIFNQADFGERFAVQVEQDDLYNYFVTDLTKFSSWIEKTLFLNSVYAEKDITSIDSDITKDQLWFKALATMPVQDVSCSFDDLKDQAIKKAASMTDEEMKAWSEKYAKFNLKKD